MNALDLSLLAEAARHGASTLHEAQGRTGDLPAAIRAMTATAAVAGPAFTVATRPGNNLLVHKALAIAPRGSVLVVATGGVEGHPWGYWGDILTVAAQERGIAGLVIDGCVRDLAAIAASGFPVFARGTAIRGTEKSVDGEVGGALVLGHAVVRSGDLIVGDADGVVVVPVARATETIAAAGGRTEKEAGIIAALKSGKTTLELYGWA